MVTFFITKKATYTVNRYLSEWACDLRHQVKVIAYEDLPQAGSLNPGTYIFCDQERWSTRQHRTAVELWRQLEQGKPAVILLNDPSRVLKRYELLRKLHRMGRNRFDVYRSPKALLSARFPVFLHSTNKHEGPLSPLLHHRRHLIEWLFRRGRPSRWGKLLIEEFCDVSNEGIYLKYGAFCVRGEIIPRHLFFGKQWALKDSEILGEKEVDRFAEYLRDNPHQEELRQIFEIAGIDYGRIDYAFHKGRLQTWEINTNPTLIGLAPHFSEIEKPLAAMFNLQMKSCLCRLASLAENGNPVPYRLRRPFLEK